MKKTFCVSALSFSIICASAQKTILVTDKEHLFTTGEISRIDNLLQDYNQRSGNLVVVCSDTLDVSTKSYKDSLIEVYTGDKPLKPYAIFVLLSRKNSLIQLQSNDLTKDSLGKGHTTDAIKIDSGKNETGDASEETKQKLEEFMKIVSYGIPALKEKKREEGVTIICRKAMEFLDALPKRELNR